MSTPSLKKQLAHASLITTLVALLLSTGMLLGYEFVMFRADRVQDLRTEAELLGRSIAPALLFHDPRTASSQLQPLEHRKGLVRAAIYDEAGQLFARLGAPAADTMQALQTPPLRGDAVRFDGDLLALSQAIRHDGEPIGSVYIEVRHDVASRMVSYLLIQAVSVLLSLGVALAVFGRLHERITGPLTRITDVAGRVVRQRDWGLRAQPEAAPDINTLVLAFNDMLAVVQSRTEELEHESAERQRIEQQLRDADRRKDVFLATLAHELRNPLAPMTIAVALLQDERSSAESRTKGLAILDRQLHQIVRLIDDLLDVSRIATGKLQLRMEAVDLVAVVRSAVEVIEPAARQRRQSIDIDLPSRPCRMVGDSARLLQIITNLLTNASRYSPPQGRIVVGLESRGTEIELHVKDTGMGIEPSMLERIFELFEQVDKSLERGNVGLGIGLTLARRLAQLHGGDITVQSAGLGHGACFTVRLPGLDEQAFAGAVPVAGPAAAEAGPTPALRLLMADDNEDFASTMAAMLESLGHEVVLAHNGLAALQALQAGRYDAAILDIGMPQINGYDLAQMLRRSGDPALTLIAVSGWGRAEDRQRSQEAGFDHHLVKPIAPQALLSLLAQLTPASSQPRPGAPNNPNADGNVRP